MKGHKVANCPKGGTGKNPVNQVDKDQGNGGETEQTVNLGGIDLGGDICCVTKDAEEWIKVKGKKGTLGMLAAVDRKAGNKAKKWEKIKATIDSGAVDTVGPRNAAQSVPVKEGKGSREGVVYRAANGTIIRNEGEKKIKGRTKEGKPISMVMQVADVKKVLVSVGKITGANNKVVFDDEGSYIEDKATGEKTVIRKENGVYNLEMWVEVEEEGENECNGVDENGNATTGFARLDDSVL